MLHTVVTVVLLLGLLSQANAGVIVVDDLGDPTPATGGTILRDAIGIANPGDTIFISASGTITLAGGSGALYIDKDLTIIGPEPAHLTIDGSNVTRMVEVDNAGGTLLFFYGMRFANMSSGNECFWIRGGDTYFENCVFTALNNIRTVILKDAGFLELFNCTFTQNFGLITDGGALYNTADNFAAVNTTFATNTLSAGHGGAIYHRDGLGQMVHCTVIDNHVLGSGQQGGGINVFGGLGAVLEVQNTVIAENSAAGPGNDYLGNVTSIGYNLIQDPATSAGWIATDLQGPGLQHYLANTPLEDGFGMMYFPITSPNSILIDQVGNIFAGLDVDTRRAPRNMDGNSTYGAVPDIGAVEYTYYLVDNLQGGAGITNSLAYHLTNINAGVSAPPYFVAFDVPGGPPFTINLFPQMTMTNEVHIDGYSQPGSKIAGPPIPGTSTARTPARPEIELNGAGVGGNGFAFTAGSDGSVVDGLTMNRFASAISILADDIHVWGCHLGTDVIAQSPLPNSVGINIGQSSGADLGFDAVIGGGDEELLRNVISGNTNRQVQFSLASGANNEVIGNIIGTDGYGEAAVDNSNNTVIGIYLVGSDTTLIEDNLISDNLHGIYFNFNGPYEAKIIGNYIGTNVWGTSALPNRGHGIGVYSDAKNIVIGGDHPLEANVISGNGSNGINCAISSDVIIVGNFIGTSHDGMNRIDNFTGISLSSGATNINIGGPNPGESNIISGNSNYGVEVNGNTTTGNLIEANFIGTSVNGNASIANNAGGIRLYNQTQVNAIIDNLISGNNAGAGVLIEDANTSFNTVEGNRIGTNVAGNAALANDEGVIIQNAASQNKIGGSIALNEGNQISGNTSVGVLIADANTADNLVQGNNIGLNNLGTAALANGEGVRLTTSCIDNTIGGTADTLGNTISGNNGNGVLVSNAGGGNKIQGNKIGVNPAGLFARPNGQDGIYVAGTTSLIIGGGPTTINVISGNLDEGIELAGADNNTINNNIIGLGSDSITAIGNTSDGILITSNLNVIGSAIPGNGNIIGANGGSGISIGSGNGNEIRINEIFSNGGLGIDLDADGAPSSSPTTNNGRQYPILVPPSNCGATTKVTYSMQVVNGRAYSVEFFEVPNGNQDPTGYGEGDKYLTVNNVVGSINGFESFSFDLGMLITPGNYITATVTDLTTNSTSEFSAWQEVQPQLVVSTNEFQAVSCNGGNNGIAEATYTEGTTPMTYLWNDGAAQTTQQATGLTAGTYNVLVTDANGCAINAGPVTISQPPAFSVSTTSLDEQCNGACDGSLTASATGGTTPYTYQWDNGLPVGANHLNLCPGTYNLVVTDANSCTAAGVETINPAPILTSSFSVNDTTQCFTGNNFVFTSTGLYSGGATFQWDFGDLSGSTSENPVHNYALVGNYQVRFIVTDGLCADTSYLNVEVFDEPQINLNPNGLSCNGTNDGWISSNVTGGTTPYSYNWLNSLLNPIGQVTDTAFGLVSGTYYLQVTDANGCSITSVAVMVNEPSAVGGVVNSTDPTCNGVCDGTITITASGGVAPYQYTKDGGGNWWPNGNFIGVCDGNYDIIIEDANGCQWTTPTLTINEPSAVTYTALINDENCSMGDGSITLLAGGGAGGPYQFSIDNGNTFQGTNSFNSLSANTFQIVIQDINGCQVTGSEVVANVPGVIIDSVATSDPSCTGFFDGSIEVFGVGGQTPYQFSIDNGGNYQAGNSFTGLNAGAYQVVIMDANNCISGAVPITLTDPAPEDATFTYPGTVFCDADNNPAATITGDPGGAFSESGGTNLAINATTGEIDLTSTPVGGPYIVQYVTAGPCPDTSYWNITIVATPNPSITQVGDFCENDPDTALVATPQGGLWSGDGIIDAVNGVFSPSAAGIGFHTIKYDVTIAGCTGVDSITIVVHGIPDATILSDTINCLDFIQDTLQAQTPGGIWGGNGITDTQLGIFQPFVTGTYEVTYTLTNGPGCSDTDTIYIDVLSLPTVTMSSLDSIYCENDVPVPVTGTPAGGAFYSVNAANFFLNAYDPSISGIGIDTIAYVWTDQFGCTGFDFEIVTVNPVPGPPAAQVNYYYCFGDAIQPLIATATGGGIITWYSDSLLTNQIGTGSPFTPSGTVTPGVHTFYATEEFASGCASAATTIRVVIYDGSFMDAGDPQTICLGDSAILNATAPPGTAFQWSNDGTISDTLIPNPTVTPTENTIYYLLTSTPNAGCIYIDSVIVYVEVGNGCGMDFYNAFSPDGDGVNDTWEIDGLARFPENKVMIFNRWGDELNSFENYNNVDVVWDGTNSSNEQLPAGTYFYVIEIESNNRQFSGWVQLSR